MSVIFQFEYDIPGFNFWSHFLLGCSLWVSCIVVWCVTLIWGKPIHQCFKYCFSFFLFFFWYSHYACVIICLCDLNCGMDAPCLFQSFILFFSLGISVAISSSWEVLSHVHLLLRPTKAFFISIAVFLIWSTSFWFCLEFTSSLHYPSIFSCFICFFLLKCLVY